MACERGRRGEVAEALAEAYLARQGYRTLARRFRVAAGEIDLVAHDGDVLAFVEVRSARGVAFGHPLASVTPSKQGRIVRAARAYLTELSGAWPPMRFDVVGVCFARVDDDAVRAALGAPPPFVAPPDARLAAAHLPESVADDASGVTFTLVRGAFDASPQKFGSA